MRDFQFPGRSPVRSTKAMVATSHPLASAAALSVLREGGGAMDAAVCAAAVLAVVEPHSTGIGGDCFCLYVPRGEGDVLAFNGSGRAPMAADPAWYREHGFEAIPTYGPHSVTIPGAVDAWCRLLADHGRLPIERVLAPAIGYAADGYVVHDRVASDWHKVQDRLASDEVAARILLADGQAPAAGAVHRQPQLAKALRAIAQGGRAAFYEGWLAEDMVARLRAGGGLHTLADFASTRGDYVQPIRTAYRGVDVWQMPPNNQGLTALIMLTILSGFDLASLDPLGADRLHIEIEAGRLAYQIRDSFIADPERVHVPVEELLSSAYIDRLRARIDPSHAASLPPVAMAPSDTVYLSVIDADRNAVSFINSTYHSFGSGVVAPRSGIVLQNRGSSFRLDPAHPNCIGPAKRPMHTIMPGMATRNGRVLASFGVMGGDFQPFGHVHLLTNILDHGLDPQAALDLGRVFHDDGAVLVERGIPAAAIRGLQLRGHRVTPADEALGGGQIVVLDWERGTLTGGSDPRKDGLALGL